MNESIMQRKVFIFNLDSIILDSVKIYDIVEHEIIKTYGKIPREHLGEERQRVLTMAGNTNPYRVYYKYLIDSYGLKLTIDKLEKIRNDLLKMLASNLKLKDGVQELISYLKNKGKCLAAVTMFTRNIYRIYCEKNKNIRSQINFDDTFGTNVVTCEDVKNFMPHPEIYDKARSIFNGYLSDDIVVIEDSLFGNMSAKTAGLDIISIYNEYQWKNIDKLKVRSKFYFESFKDLLENLKSEEDLS